MLPAAGSGRPLPDDVRAFHEARFGHPFADVRVHTDDTAAQAARSLSAKAFTRGNDVVFGQGQWAPHSSAGRRLLAHELAHVVQQRAGTHLSGEHGDDGDVHEQQADRAAALVVQGQSARSLFAPSRAAVSVRRPGAVQREPEEVNANETKSEFAARVHERAATRLTKNIGALGQWSDYVQSMSGFQLEAQLLTQVATSFAQTAAPTAVGRAQFEEWAGTHNKAQRDWRGSQLDVESTYRERSNRFMGFLSSVAVTGYDTTPSVAENLQVLAGDRSRADLPRSVHHGPNPLFAEYEGPVKRWLTGESGGCQTCHDINLAWQKTAERWGDPLPYDHPMFEQFERYDTGFTPLSSMLTAGFVGSDQKQALGDYVQSLGASAPGTPDASTARAIDTYVPTTAVPEAVATPPPRTDLCGALPDVEDAKRIPQLEDWGEASATVASVVSRIDSVLTPLGPRGYRVLPRQDFDALYAMTPGKAKTVRDGIVARIAQRQQDYAKLRADIQAGKVPYEELCPIVDELLPTTNALVRWQALQDVHAWQSRERLLQVLELVLVALSILFPPSMVFTVPAGMALGLARASLGHTQQRQGRQWQQGTGAGVYSLAQESEAPDLADRGKSNVRWGIFGFLTSAFGSVRMLQHFSQVRAHARLLAELESGTVSITSALRPNQILRAKGGQLMLIDTEARLILGYGRLQGGRLTWMPLRMPFPADASGTTGLMSLAPSLPRAGSSLALSRALPGFGLQPVVGTTLAGPGTLVARSGSLAQSLESRLLASNFLSDRKGLVREPFLPARKGETVVEHRERMLDAIEDRFDDMLIEQYQLANPDRPWVGFVFDREDAFKTRFDAGSRRIVFTMDRSLNKFSVAEEVQHALDYTLGAQDPIEMAEMGRRALAAQRGITVDKLRASFSEADADWINFWWHRRVFTRLIQNIHAERYGLGYLKPRIGEVHQIYQEVGGKLTLEDILKTQWEGVY